MNCEIKIYYETLEYECFHEIITYKIIHILLLNLCLPSDFKLYAKLKIKNWKSIALKVLSIFNSKFYFTLSESCIFLRKLYSNIRDASIPFLFLKRYFNIQLGNTYLAIKNYSIGSNIFSYSFKYSYFWLF